MIRLVRELRLIPVVMIAISSLLALKVIGLLVEGGFGLFGAANNPNSANKTEVAVAAPESVPVQPPKRSWAGDAFNFPGGRAADSAPAVPKPDLSGPDITGSVAEKPKEAPPAKPKPAEPEKNPGGTVITADPKPLSPAERAILERLQERRTELETRARELDLRETLLKAAEKKLEDRLAEIKEAEDKAKAASQGRAEGESNRLKNLVTMYESMKAKDAAKIFDRLDMRVLMEVAAQINPRRMSDILAQMTPETAERLTVEFANRGAEKAPQQAAELPKIEGKPTN